MRITFSTTGKSFAPGNSGIGPWECLTAKDLNYATRTPSDMGPVNRQVVVELNTEQARELVATLLHDYPYLHPEYDAEPSDASHYNR